MKGVALIFLVFIYAFSTTGVSLKGSYCCGKLQSVKLTLDDYGKDIDGCCKTKYQSFKIKDTHAAADALAVPAVHPVVVNFPSQVFQTLAYSSIRAVVVNNSNAPPLYTGVPVYISDCIYRI